MYLSPTKGVFFTTISNSGIVGAAAPGTVIPSSGTTLLDGTATEVISVAANTQDSWGVDIFIYNTGGAATAGEACCDIFIGDGAGAERLFIPALICGYSNGAGGGWHYFFPLHVPSGSRLSASLASVRVSINANIIITLYGGSPPPFRTGRQVNTYGTQINNARGQSITPTASGGAASITELSTGTSFDHFAFLPGFQAATDTTVTPSGSVSVGIGLGPSTEERLGTWLVKKDINEDMSGPFPFMPAFRDVPVGTRLTLLTSNCGVNDASYDGLIYAI